MAAITTADGVPPEGFLRPYRPHDFFVTNTQADGLG